jgi:hypothetical protein
MNIIIYGGLIGFIYFLYKLESPGMGNIIFRVNSDGIKSFSFDSLLNIIIAPMKYIHFWTNIELYHINWIITTLIGGIIGYIIMNLLTHIYSAIT